MSSVIIGVSCGVASEASKAVQTCAAADYVRQSPWLSVSNKQFELLGRYMAELGITPASRARVSSVLSSESQLPTVIKVVIGSPDGTTRDLDGNIVDDHRDAVVVPDGL